ncbi:hypothetical protein GCM10028833_02390 [Glycomyces tarimensis]
MTLHSSSVTWHSSDFASVKFHVWRWGLGPGEDRNHVSHRARRSSLAGCGVADPDAPSEQGPSAQPTVPGCTQDQLLHHNHRDHSMSARWATRWRDANQNIGIAAI